MPGILEKNEKVYAHPELDLWFLEQCWSFWILHLFISVFSLRRKTFPTFCQCRHTFRNLCPFSEALLDLNIPVFMTKSLTDAENHVSQQTNQELVP